MSNKSATGNEKVSVEKHDASKVKHEVDKINRGERSPIDIDNQLNKTLTPNAFEMDRMDLSSMPPAAMHEHIDLMSDNDSDLDDDDNEHKDADSAAASNMQSLGLPSYSKFESDFKRRIDEMNANSRFDMQLKGKSLMSQTISLLQNKKQM